MANTSEGAADVVDARVPGDPLPVRLPLHALTGKVGFKGDARFGRVTPGADGLAGDPGARAFADGHAAGLAQAQQAAARATAAAAADAAAADAADDAAREGLSLAFTRLDTALEERLRLRLRETVMALCERALAPLALDETALVRRIARVTAMLARADDTILIKLNPEDLQLLAPRFRADWEVQPDASLERGAIRVESGSGGVEDGPEQWRQAIAEALQGC